MIPPKMQACGLPHWSCKHFFMSPTQIASFLTFFLRALICDSMWDLSRPAIREKSRVFNFVSLTDSVTHEVKNEYQPENFSRDGCSRSQTVTFTYTDDLYHDFDDESRRESLIQLLSPQIHTFCKAVMRDVLNVPDKENAFCDDVLHNSTPTPELIMMASGADITSGMPFRKMCVVFYPDHMSAMCVNIKTFAHGNFQDAQAKITVFHASYNRFHVNCCLHSHLGGDTYPILDVTRHKDLLLAFCMGTHPRLGSNSPVRVLSNDVLDAMILPHVHQSKEPWTFFQQEFKRRELRPRSLGSSMVKGAIAYMSKFFSSDKP